MSIASAHRFIARVRRDRALRERVAQLGTDPALEELVAFGTAEGLAFGPEELRAAWRQDWALRALAAEGANGSAAGNRESSLRAGAI